MTNEIAAAMLLAGLVVSTAGAAPPPSVTLTPEDRIAVFKTAGFTARGNQYVRCVEDPPTSSYVPGKIEVVDLNGDGRPEAWVTESSTFCYGSTEQFFVLVTKDESGKWRVLLEEVGVPTALETRRQGWPDIEVGGPGVGKFPVRHWNGKTYAGPTR